MHMQMFQSEDNGSNPIFRTAGINFENIRHQEARVTELIDLHEFRAEGVRL